MYTTLCVLWYHATVLYHNTSVIMCTCMAPRRDPAGFAANTAGAAPNIIVANFVILCSTCCGVCDEARDMARVQFDW